MESIFFALISFFGWGVGDIFGTIATRKLGGFSTTLWTLIAGAFLFTLLIPFAMSDFKAITPILFFLTAVISIFFIIALVAFYQALKIESSPLIGTIASSFAAVTVILSLIFLGETISIWQAIFIVVIFIGVVLSSFEFEKLKKARIILSTGIIFALIAMLSWGIYFAFIKIPVSKLGWFWPTYITYLSFPLLLFFLKIAKIKIKKPQLKVSLKPLLASLILTGSAEFGYNFAISKGQVALVAPIAGSYPVLFVLLSFILFRDPVTKQQIIGIVVALLGIVLLALNN
ncbi:DMT family transporter [Candidatus Daviesbacteria bacterium]|nr:DMT family transporter [Candidatus Daviesbacteria bacterium]